MSETREMQYVEVRRYRHRDEQRISSVYYGQGEPKAAEEAEKIVRDFVVRVDTLRDARRDVVVTLDGDYLILGTRVPAPVPVAPPAEDGPARKPAKRARATKKVSRG